MDGGNCSANEYRQPRLGCPAIYGELGKLGIKVSETTVASTWYATDARHRRPGVYSWRTTSKISSPPISSWFRQPHFGCCSCSSSFPMAAAGRFTSRLPVIRLRSGWRTTFAGASLGYGAAFSVARSRRQLRGDVSRRCPMARNRGSALCLRSPWRNAYAERLIGSIRRECLDHVIVLNESGLRRVLRSYFGYYAHSRTHLSLHKDAPIPRPVQLPELGRVVELPEVGGLHHRNERCAA